MDVLSSNVAALGFSWRPGAAFTTLGVERPQRLLSPRASPPAEKATARRAAVALGAGCARPGECGSQAHRAGCLDCAVATLSVTAAGLMACRFACKPAKSLKGGSQGCERSPQRSLNATGRLMSTIGRRSLALPQLVYR